MSWTLRPPAQPPPKVCPAPPRLPPLSRLRRLSVCRPRQLRPPGRTTRLIGTQLHPASAHAGHPSGRAQLDHVETRVLARCQRRRHLNDAEELIPARAGRTYCHAVTSRNCGAHPRAGGADNGITNWRLGFPGSSPRGRGGQVWEVTTSTGQGLIPARAGRTLTLARSASRSRAHPRAGGADLGTAKRTAWVEGSSPSGRGGLGSDADLKAVRQHGIHKFLSESPRPRGEVSSTRPARHA